MHKLVIKCESLDLNSQYSYMLICTHFKKTSIVCESKGKVIGFISAYILPDRQNTIFIWQVAVDSSYRGNGIALKMLSSILSRKELSDIKYIHATISPSNIASRNLFKKLALYLNTSIRVNKFLKKELFINESHEEEELYQIGPINL
ncbi:diaminobutyrate acetyltransferase [Hydrogenimonas thermophila]|uniref:L-2,4-diaminobutyric acid acetyltransferase n=2 Tax=Hydrogenimonas thermophila TaxID=223786 RepID=A0A1I5UEB3_9BACT|nr:diaminobutyrate acetyltransferase [Hydrogenimonas thermophila]